MKQILISFILMSLPMLSYADEAKPPTQTKQKKPSISEESDSAAKLCRGANLVTDIAKKGKKYRTKPWYGPKRGVAQAYVVKVPRKVGHRKQVQFTATIKDKTMAQEFKWVQYIRGYIWSGHTRGGRYNGGNRNQGRIIDIQGNKTSRITDIANSVPKVKKAKQKPPVSIWTFDDLNKVGHYTTKVNGKKISMVDTPGLDSLRIHPNGRTFFDADFEFRAYAVCPLSPKLAYARCVWNTKLTVESFTFVRTADTPVCTVFKKPINLLKGGDPMLNINAKTPPTQDYFSVPGGW